MFVNVPPTLADMAPQLQEFFDTMVHKLHVNSHKDAIRDDDIDGLLDKMEGEIAEFREQRAQNANDPNMLSELGDVSNFSFLLFAFLRAKGVKDAKEQFLDEYFDIDPIAGAITCRKTRSGSPLKVGEQVRGTVRNRVRYLRTQHAGTGVSVSVAFRDLFWWKHYGEWPRRPLRYLHEARPKGMAAIDNLELSEGETVSLNPPFVSQYKPRGRESNQNYGKWVYQRRHAFKLIRVGYWNTAEEAAREGIKAWKAKIREPKNV